MCRYFSWTEIKYLIVLLLGIYISFDLQYFHFALQTQWQVFAVLMLSLLMFGDNFWQRLKIILVTGLIATVSVMVVVLIPEPIIQFVVLAMVSFFTVYIARLNSYYVLPVFMINIFLLLATNTRSSFIGGSQNSLSIFVALLLVILLQMLFLPFYRVTSMRDNLKQLTNRLQKLHQEIFSCLLHPDYKDNLYLYERRIHIAKNRYQTSLRNIQRMSLNHSREHIKQYDSVFVALIECAQLRLRVSDQTIFELCKKELTSVCQVANLKYDALERAISCGSTPVTTEDLSFSISRLEEIIVSVVQVAAKEPLVFYLFLAALKRYAALLDNLTQKTYETNVSK